METILFVHGTGVRTEAYQRTLELITAKAKVFLPGFEVAGCNWGEPWGARLNFEGRSIPGPLPDSIGAAAVDAAKLALWALLAEDPLLELKVAVHNPAVQGPQGPALWKSFIELGTHPGALEKLNAWNIDALWAPFIASKAASPAWKNVIEGLVGSRVGRAAEISRAVVAAFLIELRQQGESGLTGPQRDLLVATLLLPLGGAAAGLTDWLAGRLTNYVEPRRGRLTDKSAAVIGDILRYQARGGTLRNFIGHSVEKTKASVIIAHSLGGIACVDWLAEAPRSVRALVTVGSQAAYFYEIDALHSRELGTGLPEYFPKPWLNIYDQRDFLGYAASKIFEDKAMDLDVDNEQPFPASHSAYWHNDVVWEEIARVLKA